MSSGRSVQSLIRRGRDHWGLGGSNKFGSFKLTLEMGFKGRQIQESSPRQKEGSFFFNWKIIASRHYVGFCCQFSRGRLLVTPWTAARQASLSVSNSRSLPKLVSIVSVSAVGQHKISPKCPSVPSLLSLPPLPIPSLWVITEHCLSSSGYAVASH